MAWCLTIHTEVHQSRPKCGMVHACKNTYVLIDYCDWQWRFGILFLGIFVCVCWSQASHNQASCLIFGFRERFVGVWVDDDEICLDDVV